MPELQHLVKELQRHHGAPRLPRVKGPFQWVLWENSCYLLSDARRAAVFEGLRADVGLTPAAIAVAPKSVLLPLARLGGMRPGTRVFRWREIARITLEQFDGDLDRIMRRPYAEAKKALQFPNIGPPGAEKILMFCGLAPGLPLDWNGLRVLTRVGYGPAVKSYRATYSSVQTAVAPELPRGAASISRAHLLLRTHGKTVCRNDAPLCRECPLHPWCAFAQRHMSRGLYPPRGV